MSFDTDFSRQLNSDSAIVSLMEDLGEALNNNPDMLFLGGGNPAYIPEFEAIVAGHLSSLAEDQGRLRSLIGTYQSPQGYEPLLAELAHYFSELGWPVTEENICLTGGSQSAFFMLINLFAGRGSGEARRVCLPLAPEYLGYADQGLASGVFQACKPELELLGEHDFKYHVDFNQIESVSNIGAYCVSRPTNPSGNVFSAEELSELGLLADEQGVPLIIDCAYGSPFPGLVYESSSSVQKRTELCWQPNRVFVFSLSKLGMPGVRTGIVLADKSVIKALVKSNTVISLANGNLGPMLMHSILKNGELSGIRDDVILPFYRKKRDMAIELIRFHFKALSYRIHRAEGAFFLWLWFPKLKVSSAELYRRLKKRDVLVMDGTQFFFELALGWAHANQCIRISYCAADKVLEQAIQIIAQEVRKVSA